MDRVPLEKLSVAKLKQLATDNEVSKIPSRKSDIIDKILSFHLDTIKTEICEGKSLNVETFSEAIKYYYLADNNGESFALLEYYVHLSSNEQQKILNELSIKSRDLDNGDIISLLNVIPGLSWDEKAIKRIKQTSFNQVLSGATGSRLRYKQPNKDSSRYKLLLQNPTFAIYNYLAFHVYPFIDQISKRRNLEHLYTIVNNSKQGEIEKYVLRVANGKLNDVIKELQMRIPSEVSKIEYFLNSINDYKEVVNNLDKDRNLKFPVSENKLYMLTDKELLEILEYPLDYRYRSDIISELYTRFEEPDWAIMRSKYCINEGTKMNDKYPILSYGSPLNYYCFDYQTILKEWSSSYYLYRPDYSQGQDLKEVQGEILDKLITFIDEMKNYDTKNYKLLVPILKIAKDRKKGKKPIKKDIKTLLLCYDKNCFEVSDVIIDALTDRYSINKDELDIDYISETKSYINKKKYNGTTSLSNIPYKYEFVIVDVFTDQNLDDDMLYTIHNNLVEDGILLISESKNLNMNLLSKYYDFMLKYKNIYIFRPRRDIKYQAKCDISSIDKPMEYFFNIKNKKSEWVVEKNKGGGDCLFLALASALNSSDKNEKYTVEMMRERLARTVNKDNIDYWKSELIPEVTSTTNNRKKQIKLAEQLGEDFVGTMSKVLKFKPTVESKKDQEMEIIREYIMKDKFGNKDDIGILGQELNFIPIFIPLIGGGGGEYTAAICGGVSDIDNLIKKEKITLSDIILFQLDPSARHFELIKKKNGQKIFKHTDLPKSLIECFLYSCQLIKEFGFT
jgi:hypothetical protein